MIYHIEEGHCSRITAIEFKGYIQHKGLVVRLLQNPELLNDISEKDIQGYWESAYDESTTGGVSLIDLPEDDEIVWDKEEIIEPDRPAVPPTIAASQQHWPALAPQQQSQTNGLNKAFGNLSVGNAGSVRAWGTTSTSTILFPKAMATPATNEWQQKQQEIHQEDRKFNILKSQYWNPVSKDYQPDRFYDPVIEKHRCPFPACHKYYDIPQDCQV